MHIPVLLNEVLQFLNPQPGGFIIDGTVDGGGHAIEILKKISPHGIFLGIDWDKQMVERLEKRTTALPTSHLSLRTLLVHGNYADLPKILAEKGLSKADGLLLDLGFSSEQLEGKGFSFLRDEPLIMTYDEKNKPVSKILQELREQELVKILREYGEERYAPRIAEAIKKRLYKGSIATTGELATTVSDAVPQGYERGRIHPATRTFQALRIYANGELENVTRVIGELPRILQQQGRIVILTFHSLEDRIVKHSLREMEKKGMLRILTKKPVVAAETEIAENPRSRSAKLRAAVMDS